MKKSNRKLHKALLLTCCALALVAISVGATLAYLTDSEAVTNVFTVGKVVISLDEAKTNEAGEPLNAAGQVVELASAERISGNRSANEQYTNTYHLIPGETYTKDPTVHVDTDSEACWLFVKVENALEPIEAEAAYTNDAGDSATGTIAEQMVAFSWAELNGVENVYYQKHDGTRTDYVVFKAFKVSGDATNVAETTDSPEGEIISNSNVYLPAYEEEEIKVTAYAIQMAGFENDAAGAWAAGKFN